MGRTSCTNSGVNILGVPDRPQLKAIFGKNPRLLLNHHPGFVAIDKPVGLSSNNLIEKLRKALKGFPRCSGLKIGHGGTLDSLASGLMLVLTGAATRLFDDLNSCAKEYVADIRLGVETDTYDIKGQIVRSHTGELPGYDDIINSLGAFKGEVLQTPPPYSALKVKGIPMYRLAMHGGEIADKTRKVTVHRLELVLHDANILRLVISCSSGFYVRSLAHDIGCTLGCGATLSGLRRTRIGPFGIEDALDIENAVQAIASGVNEDGQEGQHS